MDNTPTTVNDYNEFDILIVKTGVGDPIDMGYLEFELQFQPQIGTSPVSVTNPIENFLLEIFVAGNTQPTASVWIEKLNNPTIGMFSIPFPCIGIGSMDSLSFYFSVEANNTVFTIPGGNPVVIPVNHTAANA